MLALAGHRKHVASLAFSPDGSLLASTGTDLSVRLWAVGAWTQRVLTPPETTSVHGPATVAFSPDGRWLAARRMASSRVWALPTGVVRADFTSADMRLTYGHVAFAPVGRTFAIARNSYGNNSADSGIQLWCAEGWVEQRSETRGGPAGGSILAALPSYFASTFAFNADATKLVGPNGVVEVATGAVTPRPSTRVNRHSLASGSGFRAVTSRPTTWFTQGVAASPTDPDLAVTLSANALAAYRLGSGERLYEVEAAKTFFRAAAFLPDGGSLVAVNNDGSAWHLDAATGEVLRTFDWRTGGLRSVAVSPDGQLAAAGTTRGAILVWDLA